MTLHAPRQLSPSVVFQSLLWSVAVLMPIGACGADEAPKSVYLKRDCWAETMVATRAAYLDADVSGADAQQALGAIWKRLRSDFPALSARYQQQTRRDYLQYFAQRDAAKFERTLIQNCLGNDAGMLQQQLSELIRLNLPVNDPRWLELYGRAVRARDCRQTIDRVWIVELGEAFDARWAELIATQADYDDPGWLELLNTAEQVVEVMPAWRRTEIGSFGTALDQLQTHCGNRFLQADSLRSRWEARSAAWLEVLERVKRGDPDGIAKLSGACEEIQQLQRDMILALDGMPDYLEARAGIDLLAEWDQQYGDLEADIANRSHFERVAAEAYRPEALILDPDRDPLDVVLRRTAALLADLRQSSAEAKLAPFSSTLEMLQAAGGSAGVECVEARRVLYADACRLRRQVALSNPLLDFDEILFVKHHRALFNHMCDQYYGMAATPGGGLYVLSGAFGEEPKVRDVLADSVVASPARLAGQRLLGGPNVAPSVSFDGQGNRHGTEGQGGTFLSPDLSYDGRSIVFAYVENRGDMQHRHHVDPSQGHWAEGRCYHIFSVDIDGSNLRQLTDGTWNDFDPCWLPNGRIAFISERRGGYLRCGRVCPNYTLFDMAGDGSDIQCLSFHETNEWHPSVTNDGMILWTRWDYVDRHGCTAHMPWLTTLDGRDPRPVHGNYAPRPTRPDMEVDCRAVPNSRQLVATAAPHHGQAYGSLIMIDPTVADDDGMGPLRRVTPEIGFPESQGGGQVYGTPWPLSEDYYLCVYDPHMRAGGGRQGGSFARGEYGIYLIDAFGNRELLYRDDEIAALSPIPVRARPAPPVPVELAHRGLGVNPTTRASEPIEAAEPAGSVAVMNVYDSLLPWPEGTRIHALRVLQVFPMSVPSGRPPHETGWRIVGAGDSVVPVRHVLGTVPVEEDGSAYFEVPANKELFFQALDKDGLAVQSMRSATHVREGERLVCVGCHNPRHESTPMLTNMPLALQRKPSQLVPDVEGSRPFSYPLLVQPVLDRHCVACHEENEKTAPNLGREPISRNWYASYNSLIQEFGFYDYQDGYRTTPGMFGAKASKLYELLQAGHYDVRLSDEEMRRITLWLDCASMFYGVYEQEGGQAQLRGEFAFPTLE